MKKLSEIPVGKEVEIVDFENNELKIKLMEMGFLIGEKIIITQKAPYGDPMSISVCHYQISLRLDEADKITVKETECLSTKKEE